MKKCFLSFIIIGIFIGLAINPSITGYTVESQKSYEETDETPIENDEKLTDILFDTYIKLFMKISHKPSIAAGIIHNDTLVWQKGYGYYDLENQKPTNKDILYLQASVSKTVTATALMQLFDQGKFNLTDDVNKYLPFELRNPNHPDIPITIEMILSHRSSLAYDNLYWLCLCYLPGDPDVPSYPDPWLKEYLTPNGSAYSETTWSNAKPGEKYLYANIGFSIIAYLVEILSEQNFNDYCREYIFEPLEMHNTSFRLRDHNINNTAVPYEYKNRRYFRHPHYGIHPLYAAITLRTSVEEYSHFLITHMNGGVWNGVSILKNTTVELMQKPHFSPEDKSNYGLGWEITKKPFRKKQISHSGGYVGVHDLITIKPHKDIAVILFSNQLDSELMTSKIERKAFNAINKALLFKAYRIAS